MKQNQRQMSVCVLKDYIPLKTSSIFLFRTFFPPVQLVISFNLFGSSQPSVLLTDILITLHRKNSTKNLLKIFWMNQDMGNKKCIRFIQLLAIRFAIGNLNNVKVSNCEIPLVSDYLKSNKKNSKICIIYMNRRKSLSFFVLNMQRSKTQLYRTVQYRMCILMKYNQPVSGLCGGSTKAEIH